MLPRIERFGILLILPALLFAQGVESSIAPTPENTSLWGLIQQGGWAMYPLGLCSLTMIFLIIHSWRETSRRKFIPEHSSSELSQKLQERDFPSAARILEREPTVLNRALKAGLDKARAEAVDANKERVEMAFIEALEYEESAISQWINYLNVVATVSPMIGLLGTVSGMIGAFSTIASGGMGRPELLAGDIGEALITTATGLVIGIPAMIAYFVLRNRLNNVMLATTQEASRHLDRLSDDVRDAKPPEDVHSDDTSR